MSSHLQSSDNTSIRKRMEDATTGSDTPVALGRSVARKMRHKVDIVDVASNIHSSIDTTKKSMETKVSRLEHMLKVINEDNKKNLDTHIQAIKQDNTDKIVCVDKKLNELASTYHNLNTLYEQKLQQLQTNIQMVTSEWESKLKNVSSTNDVKLQNINAMNKAIEDAVNKFKQEVQTLDAVQKKAIHDVQLHQKQSIDAIKQEVAQKANVDKLQQLDLGLSQYKKQTDEIKQQLHSLSVQQKDTIDHKLSSQGTKLQTDITTVSKQLQDSSSALNTGLADVRTQHQKLATRVSSLEASISNLDKKFQQDIVHNKNQITELANTVASLVNKVSTLENKKQVDTLHIGTDVNIPEQPESKKVSGVWEVAPTAISVNGAVVLHDIGYTTKKGYNVTIDPDTGRLLVYYGK